TSVTVATTPPAPASRRVLFSVMPRDRAADVPIGRTARCQRFQVDRRQVFTTLTPAGAVTAELAGLPSVTYLGIVLGRHLLGCGVGNRGCRRRATPRHAPRGDERGRPGERRVGRVEIDQRDAAIVGDRERSIAHPLDREAGGRSLELADRAG